MINVHHAAAKNALALSYSVFHTGLGPLLIKQDAVLAASTSIYQIRYSTIDGTQAWASL